MNSEIRPAGGGPPHPAISSRTAPLRNCKSTILHSVKRGKRLDVGAKAGGPEGGPASVPQGLPAQMPGLGEDRLPVEEHADVKEPTEGRHRVNVRRWADEHGAFITERPALEPPRADGLDDRPAFGVVPQLRTRQQTMLVLAQEQAAAGPAPRQRPPRVVYPQRHGRRVAQRRGERARPDRHTAAVRQHVRQAVEPRGVELHKL